MVLLGAAFCPTRLRVTRVRVITPFLQMRKLRHGDVKELPNVSLIMAEAGPEPRKSGLRACAPSCHVLLHHGKDKMFKNTGGNEKSIVSCWDKRDPLKPDRKPRIYRGKD